MRNCRNCRNDAFPNKSNVGTVGIVEIFLKYELFETIIDAELIQQTRNNLIASNHRRSVNLMNSE